MGKVWMQSQSICLAMGDAVALNLMFESQRDHELFFKYWKKYLGGMADLINYNLSPTGWKLLFRTKSTDEIKNAYHELRKQSRKAKKAHTLKDESRMLSEHFRIFLSQFVRRSNARLGRSGAKVKHRFHKYVLNEHADYEAFFKQLIKQDHPNPQRNKKYQADESSYDKQNEMSEDSVWKVGTRIYKGLEEGFRRRFGVVMIPPMHSVLRKFYHLPKNIIFHPPYT